MDNQKEYVSRTSAAYMQADTLIRSYVAEATRNGHVTPKLVRVDPAMAQVLVDCNEGNRNIRPGKIAQYKRDMNEGRFKENGESIIVDTAGRLADGQHRLYSILETGKSFNIVVSFGVAPDAMDTVDQGAARKTADFLKIGGVANATIVSAMLKMVLGYERAQAENSSGAIILLGSPGRVTSAEVVERLDAANRVGDLQLISEAATYAASNSKAFRGMLTPQVVAFLYWLLGSKSQKDTVQMLDKIRTQLNFTAKDPVFAVYNKLKSLDTRNAPVTERVEAVVRGWNSFRAGRQVGSFQIQGIIPVPR